MVAERGERARAGLIAASGTAGLIGWLYLAHVGLGLPFVPLDLADALIRLAPGGLATAGIEALGAGAKLLIEALALLLAWAGGSSLAFLALSRAPARHAPGIWRAAALALAALAISALIELVIAWNGAAPLPSLIGLGLSYGGWAALLAWALSRLRRTAPDQSVPDHARSEPAVAHAAQPTPAPVMHATRRQFVARFVAFGLGVALAGPLLGETIRRSRARPPAALPPAPAAAPAAAVDAGPAAVAVPATSVPGPTPAATPAAAGPVAAAPLDVLPSALPTPGTPLPAFVPAPGTRPFFTPGKDFYVVNIATRDPLTDASQWRLAVSGLVDHPLGLSYADLLSLPRVDVPVTLECISNPLAGKLIGTAQFNGVRLADVLQPAGLRQNVVELATRSLDGYTESLPLSEALDPRTLLVYGMDGLALATEHGYPLRLFVPSHYGMKNPKWLQEISAVAEPVLGYWVVRGWDHDAIVKTTSVLDTRGELARGAGGSVGLGGIAYAGARGISQVLLSIDGETTWRAATLEPGQGGLTWQRWRYEWSGAAPGSHDITVRATDGRGEEQTSFVSPPHPDGASGWQRAHVIVK